MRERRAGVADVHGKGQGRCCRAHDQRHVWPHLSSSRRCDTQTSNSLFHITRNDHHQGRSDAFWWKVMMDSSRVWELPSGREKCKSGRGKSCGANNPAAGTEATHPNKHRCKCVDKIRKAGDCQLLCVETKPLTCWKKCESHISRRLIRSGRYLWCWHRGRHGPEHQLVSFLLCFKQFRSREFVGVKSSRGYKCVCCQVGAQPFWWRLSIARCRSQRHQVRLRLWSRRWVPRFWCGGILRLWGLTRWRRLYKCANGSKTKPPFVTWPERPLTPTCGDGAYRTRPGQHRRRANTGSCQPRLMLVSCGVWRVRRCTLPSSVKM